MRIESLPKGGRCGSLVDHYRVVCPDAEVDVFADAFHCGPGETFE